MQNKSVPVMFEFVCRECNLFLIYFTFSFQRHVFNSVNFSALTHQFWSKLSPHTCWGFLHQTSALTRIALGLVDRTELSRPAPDQLSSLGRGKLGSASCSCSRRFSRRNWSVSRSNHGGSQSLHLWTKQNNDSSFQTNLYQLATIILSAMSHVQLLRERHLMISGTAIIHGDHHSKLLSVHLKADTQDVNWYE